MLIEQLRRFATRVRDSYPTLRGLVDTCWSTYEQIVFSTAAYYNRKRYSEEATVNPYRLLEVNSDDVRYYSGSFFDFLTDSGTVSGGGWDRQKELLKNEDFHRSFEQRFLFDTEWEQTEMYNRIAKEIENQRHSRHCSIAGFEHRLARLDSIFEDIETNGYQTQRELFIRDGSTVTKITTRGLVPLLDRNIIRHEIAVNIGREGHFFVNDGRHRASMCKLLDLDSVPVRVLVRHAEWQSIRSEIAQIADEVVTPDMSIHELKSVIEDELRRDFDGVFLGLDHPDIEPLLEDPLFEQ